MKYIKTERFEMFLDHLYFYSIVRPLLYISSLSFKALYSFLYMSILQACIYVHYVHA